MHEVTPTNSTLTENQFRSLAGFDVFRSVEEIQEGSAGDPETDCRIVRADRLQLSGERTKFRARKSVLFCSLFAGVNRDEKFCTGNTFRLYGSPEWGTMPTR